MPTPDTKQRILDAAEFLFAEQGVGPTSLRAVIAAAGVNTAAIHYHFGSKQALVEAVLARRIDPLNQQRLKHLERLEAAFGDEPIPVVPLLEAFLEPTLGMGEELGGRGRIVASLIAHLHAEQGKTLRELVEPRVRDVMNRFAAAAVRSVPGLTQEEAIERLEYVIGGMARSFAGLIIQSQEALRDPEALRERLARMIRFAAPGFAAPPEFPRSSDSPPDVQLSPEPETNEPAPRGPS